MVKQTGGRRTRKANMWAKAAGEYYRSHKNDPKIKEFSDVLKSPDFKKYYLSKYGKGKGMAGSQTKFSKKNFSRKQKKFSKYQKGEPEEESQEDNNMEEEKHEDYEWVKVPKKGKKAKKSLKKSQ